MRERPILFSAAMVRAILDGSKTQTRRVVTNKLTLDFLAPDMFTPGYVVLPENELCPYGFAGDRLWVKEAIRRMPNGVSSQYTADGSLTKADAWPWKPSALPGMYCPRGLSRITLEITDVRVQRLQDLSEEDARAEGAVFHDGHGVGHSGWRHDTDDGYVFGTAGESFARLWNRINGKRPGRSWADSPWVWALTFTRVHP